MTALRRAVPGATVRWRYRLVANGLAVMLPVRLVPALRSLPGVRNVFPALSYRQTRATANAGPRRIGADVLWGAGLEGAGQGVKIGIIDDGVDSSHRYFDPAGYTMPQGFPKGNRKYTSAKVIVARAFAPPGDLPRDTRLPFLPSASSHGTHVAGIAAGNANTLARGNRVSGVAPRAYIGNYRALTVLTDSGVGHDGNAPEIVAAIEAAVADGMDVINLSIGEPEIEPGRDIVALALDAASDAGVLAVAAAGNDYGEFGRGSISSPGSGDKTIAVAAVDLPDEGGADVASFSSAGPTSLSLRLKPEVSAPGVGVLSSVPGGWEEMSGTSMAAPHVTGVAALLVQRHPEWTAADLKAAIVGTAEPARSNPRGPAAAPYRVGAGVVDAAAADAPFVGAQPSTVSFGFFQPSSSASREIVLRDLGAGAGTWSVTVEPGPGSKGATVRAPSTVIVPGVLTVFAQAPTTGFGEVTGSITLTRGADVRRVPYWGRVSGSVLSEAARTWLKTPGEYNASTRGNRSLVRVYRYPERAAGVDATLDGPERVFRVAIRKPFANFGVVITSREPGVRVQPRVVVAGDENRLTGYAALPLDHNPYLTTFGNPVLAAGALRPAPGAYDLVFDSSTRAGAGRFTFRYWIDDFTPPSLRLVSRAIERGQPLRARARDSGSGVYPESVVAEVNGALRDATLSDGILRIEIGKLRPGRHRLRLQVSDYQETRNTENVPQILPNTRVLETTFVVR